MTQLDLIDGVVRGSGFLMQLAAHPVTVIGTERAAAPVVATLKPADAWVRVEPESSVADLTGDALVVITTPTALRAYPVMAARRAGVPILSDLDLAWLASGAEGFAIVGTNASEACDIVASALAAHDVFVVEPSMEQLSAMQVFRPRVAVMLRGASPLAVRLACHQTTRDCVVATDDPEMRPLARVSRTRVVWLNPAGVVEHGVYVARNRISARLNGLVEDICTVDGVPVPELEAPLAAVACALWAGLDPQTIGAALVRRFATDRRREHRHTQQVVTRASVGFARTLASRALGLLSAPERSTR